MPRTKFGSDTMLKVIIISNVMCYTMLRMLEWMRKEKHRIGTLKTRGLCGLALMAYIKLSKIGPVGNFDFWSKVNAKSQSQSQLVQGLSQRILVRVGSGFPGQVMGRAVEPMTSSYDVSLMWTRADVDVLTWLLTWSDDVIR